MGCDTKQWIPPLARLYCGVGGEAWLQEVSLLHGLEGLSPSFLFLSFSVFC